MALIRLSVMMLLLTFSMVACKVSPIEAPKPNLYIPIIDQTVCENGECHVESACKLYKLVSGKYSLDSTLPLEACHMVVGVTAKDYQSIVNYQKDMSVWIGRHCGSNP